MTDKETLDAVKEALLLDEQTGRCMICAKTPAIYDIDPYTSELYEDYTVVWLCEPCRHERAMDV